MPRASLVPALVTAAVLALAAGPAPAQHAHDAAPAEGPAALAFQESMARMHDAMAGMAYSGDADIDFARGMIPHHVAAIEMAEIVLEHGSDPAIRALAEAIISAQAEEIAELEAWLAANDPEAGHGHGHD